MSFYNEDLDRDLGDAKIFIEEGTLREASEWPEESQRDNVRPGLVDEKYI